MPDLHFQVEGAEPVPHAATPLLGLRLRVSSTPAHEPVHSAVLKCKIQIDAPARAYEPREEEGLGDLFGPRARWATTMRTLFWTQVNTTLPSFEDSYRVKRGFPTWEGALESLLAHAEADA